MTHPHCDFCADPFRTTVIGLMAKGARPSAIAKHYGLRPTTVVGVGAEARRLGCLAPPKCLYCPAVVTRIGGCCASQRCSRLYGRDHMRKRRANLKATGSGKRQYDVLEGLVWPKLPRNPRARTLPKPPRKQQPESGMVVTQGAPPVSSPQGFVFIGGGRTAPIGAVPYVRMAA